MPIDKKVRFSADDNVSGLIKKLRQDSEDLGRGLIRDAQTYSQSGKENLNYIEQQIKAIERRSKVEKEGQLLSIERQKQAGTITGKDARKKISQIGLQSKEDKQQLTLLRELIETVKTTSKREIKEDQKRVEEQVKGDKRKGDKKEDEFESLKRGLQKEQLGVGAASDEQGIKRTLLSEYGERVNKFGQQVAGSQTEFHLGAEIAGAIPFIGGAVSSLMSRALGSAQKLQTAAGGLRAVSGGGLTGRHGGLTGIGLTTAEALGIEKQTAIARGSAVDAYQASREVAFLEKGTGIDRSLFLQQEQLTRSGGLGALGGTQRLTKGMQAVGAMRGQDTAILSEYLPILVNLQQEQLKLTGETNNEISTNLIAGITSLDESFKNPEYLKGTLSSLVQGFRRPSSPQMEALQFRALQEMNPDASLYELEEMRETPSLENIGGYLSQLRGVSANKETFARNIKGSFQGLSFTQARQIAEGYGETGFQLGDYGGQLGIEDYEKRGYQATGLIDARTAAWDDKFAAVGTDLVSIMSDLVSDSVPSFTGAMDALGEKFDNFSQSVGEFFGVSEEGAMSPVQRGNRVYNPNQN